MQVKELRLVNFRGFRDTKIVPRGDVLLVGEPRAGRSDVIEALRRIFQPDSTRFPLTEPLDFHAGRLDQRAGAAVVVGDLGSDLQQRFFDQLEVWDSEAGSLVEELGAHDALPAHHELVVRLCYRAEWNPDEKMAAHWVDFPKLSDTATKTWELVRRPQRDAIPFAMVQSAQRPLDLAPRSTFRRVVDAADGADFAPSIDTLTAGFAELAAELARGLQVGNALERVLMAIRDRLGSAASAAEMVRFMPEGGSLGAIIRSLGPAIELDDGAGPLPLTRHGSTLRALFGISEALFSVAGADGVVVADDFGEDLDPGSASHLAACIKARAGQAWLSTRRATVGEPFDPSEIVRLARPKNQRTVFYGPMTSTKADRVAAQLISRRILPEAASSAVAVGEGIHDSTAVMALARRMFADGAAMLPAASGISIIDAAAVGGGGIGEVPKVTRAAQMLGLHTIAFIDWDCDQAVAQQRLDAALAAADCVIRLPQNCDIESALLDELPDAVVLGALQAIQPLLASFGVLIPNATWQQAGAALRRSVAETLKSGVGFHEQFIDALPQGVYPPIARRLVQAIVKAGKEAQSGQIHL